MHILSFRSVFSLSLHHSLSLMFTLTLTIFPTFLVTTRYATEDVFKFERLLVKAIVWKVSDMPNELAWKLVEEAMFGLLHNIIRPVVLHNTKDQESRFEGLMVILLYSTLL